jgi:hypothetical protein
MSSPSNRAQRRFADNPLVLQILERIEAELSSMGTIDQSTRKAVRAIEEQEAVLQQRLLDREITPQEYYEQYSALVESVPREVNRARTKLSQTLIKALGQDTSASDA